MDLHTQRVIFWLDEHQYSRQHWEVVSEDIYTKANKDREKAIEELAKLFRAFIINFKIL